MIKNRKKKRSKPAEVDTVMYDGGGTGDLTGALVHPQVDEDDDAVDDEEEDDEEDEGLIFSDSEPPTSH